MTDLRVTRAQAIHWEIEALRQLGGHRSVLNTKRREAARLLEERARELLAQRDALGWTDLLAAVTYWGEAGERQRAQDLLDLGASCVRDYPEGAENLREELRSMREWLDALRVVPSLGAFARPLPDLSRRAA